MISSKVGLDLAVRRARRGQGQTGTNPSVGCLIRATDGRILALTHTSAGGRPHAEALSLSQIGTAAAGAHVFVTLEPCAHHGRSGSCARALADAGVASVTIGAKDQNPKVAGQGALMLVEAGIAVTWADHAPSRVHHAGFNRGFGAGGPWAVMKIATSADGGMTRATAEARVLITGEATQRQVHLLRAKSDVLITGTGTVQADKPQLNVRLPGYSGGQPEVLVWQRHMQLADVSANQVMIEAGPKLCSALFPQIDELHWYRSSTTFGTAAIRPDFLTPDPLDFAAMWPTFAKVSTRRFGADTQEIWRRAPCSQD